MVPSKKKTIAPAPRPVVKKAQPTEPTGPKVVKPVMEEIKVRKGYLAVCRMKGTDEWQVPQHIVRRNKEMLVASIPPNAEEAFVIELELPFTNK